MKIQDQLNKLTEQLKQQQTQQSTAATTTTPDPTTLLQPVSEPWLVSLKLLVGRYFSLGLSVADGIISYAGCREMGLSEFESAIVAGLIGCFQWQVGLALSSGQPIAQQFKARFFSGAGLFGALQRATGFASIAMLIAMYAIDIVTNLRAFAEVPMPIAFALAAAFSLGDEFLMFWVECNAPIAPINRQHFHSQQDDQRLQVAYLQARYVSATQKATDSGKQDGDRWAPKPLTH